MSDEALPVLANGPVVLASGSAARRRLMLAAGLDVTVIVPAVDEAEIKASAKAEGLSAAECAEHLAWMKARRVAPQVPADRLVVAADQMLVLPAANEGEKERWVDKPRDLEEAAGHLHALSGRTHELHTVVVVTMGAERLWHHRAVNRLTMRTVSEAFIARYLTAVGERALRTVGGYEIEGLGLQMMRKIEGDHTAIQGLPMLPLLDFLRARQLVPG